MLGLSLRIFIPLTHTNKSSYFPNRIDHFSIPKDWNRPPRSLDSYLSWKAEEYYHWTFQTSLICLNGIQDSKYFKAWAKFVKACWLIFKADATFLDLDESKYSFLLRIPVNTL
jgi:hypothetical protein